MVEEIGVTKVHFGFVNNVHFRTVSGRGGDDRYPPSPHLAYTRTTEFGRGRPEMIFSAGACSRTVGSFATHTSQTGCVMPLRSMRFAPEWVPFHHT